MVSVGLTGGIGSGKSIVAEMFKTISIPVYNSDIQAKLLMETNTEIKNEIIKILGVDSYIDSKINRPFISSKIFSDNNLRNSLNNIVHKHVFEDYKEWSNNKINSKFVILESAILFETGNANSNSFNISVFSPLDLKIKRLENRGMSIDEIKQRMEAQWSDEQISGLTDYVIINDEQNFISKQVLSIYENIISKIND
jgi:dephospho-CoA kinase